MNLHKYENEFRELITLSAQDRHITESAVERDYEIVSALERLANSEYLESCVFKGGTSLSKCYPGSIERFSEDIDLTFINTEKLSNKQIERCLKAVERIVTEGTTVEPVPDERNDRNKSCYFWQRNEKNRIKLEIGSSVRPEPYSKRCMKTYIQEYLESHGFAKEAAEYGLVPIELNVLNIERTFIDKIMSVKRHAICGTLTGKVRHIYDVTRLFQMEEIQTFLRDKAELKRLVRLTKDTDSFYLSKRNLPKEYNPTEPYNFRLWQNCFDGSIQNIYEHLHEELLYTDEKQNFETARQCFNKIDEILKEIEE